MHRLCIAAPAVTFEPRTTGVADELALCVGDIPLIVTCTSVTWIPSFSWLGWPQEHSIVQLAAFGAVRESPSLKRELESGYLSNKHVFSTYCVQSSTGLAEDAQLRSVEL